MEGKESKSEEVTIFEEVIYNVVNTLEWLAYLVPKMYEVELQGPPLYEDLVERLEKYITEKGYKLAIRLEAAWALGWASVSSIAVATCVHQSEKSPKTRIHKLNSNVLRHVVGIAYLRATFTLVSFGPARATPLPGGYRPEQTPPQSQVVTRDYARRAASEVVYNELASLVRGNIRFLSILVAIAALWLGTNTFIITLLLQKAHLATIAWLAFPPTLLLLLTIIILTFQLGRDYWQRIIVVWVMFVALALSPWLGVIQEQRLFIIVAAFVALIGAVVGPVSSWVTLFTGIPSILTMLKMIRSRNPSSHK